MPLAAYLSLDDHTITEFLKACRTSRDKELAQLATGLLERRLYKAIDATDSESSSVGEFVSAAKELLKKKHLDPDTFVSDSPADTPYKPYDPDAEKPATQIYVENLLGVPQEFGLLSDAVRELKRKYTLLRYYFPAEVRPEIESLAATHLKKDKK